MRREVFSVKIEPDLKKLFTDTVKEKGLSTCYVIEGFMKGWLLGIHHNDSAKVDQKANIHLTLQRVTTKVRRGYKEYVAEDNFYDPTIGWIFKDETVLNSEGHTIGCHCSHCRRF